MHGSGGGCEYCSKQLLLCLVLMLKNNKLSCFYLRSEEVAPAPRVNLGFEFRTRMSVFRLTRHRLSDDSLDAGLLLGGAAGRSLSKEFPH